MKLKLITPEKLVLERDVESVTLPGAVGQLTIMGGHDFFLTPLVSGRLFFRYTDSENKSRREDYEIGRGSVEVLRDGATVFVESAAISQ